MTMPRTKDFVKLRKQGNSLVITIPKEMIETLGWNEGNELYLEVQEDSSMNVKKA
jgi:putative addiction module antidote